MSRTTSRAFGKHGGGGDAAATPPSEPASDVAGGGGGGGGGGGTAKKAARASKTNPLDRFDSVALQNDAGVVMAAVQQHGIALKYASKSLRENRGIVLAAVRQDCNSVVHASRALKSDREVARAALGDPTYDDQALYEASGALKNDKTFVTTLVREHGGMILGYVSKNLRNDRDVVMAAVTQSGAALQFGSAELRSPME